MKLVSPKDLESIVYLNNIHSKYYSWQHYSVKSISIVNPNNIIDKHVFTYNVLL